MIADTTFAIDLMSNDKEALDRLNELTSGSITCFITTPSIFELWQGVGFTNKPVHEIQKIRRLIRHLKVLSLDEVSAEKAGQLLAHLTKKGEKIQNIDSMIAGIALANNEAVLTRNVKHFERIEGLIVEEY